MKIRMNRETAKAIDKALSILDGSKESAQWLISHVVPDIKPEKFSQAMRYYYSYKQTGNEDLVPYFDPIGGLWAVYGKLLDSREQVIRMYARKWWPYVDEYLSDKAGIISQLEQKVPKLKPLLDTDIGSEYADYYAQRLYEFFYLWLFKFPRAHWYNGNGEPCGGVIKFRQIYSNSNIWGFQCLKCGTVIPVDELEDVSYQY